MAKLKIASPDIQKLVQDVVTEAGLSNIIKFQALSVPKSKEVVKVKKASSDAEALSDKEVIIIVYEEAFDRVTEAEQLEWLRREISKVSYDSEKDKVVIGCPILSVPLYHYQKFGEKVLQSAELALTVVQQIEDEEKLRKAAAKEAKASKRRNNH